MFEKFVVICELCLFLFSKCDVRDTQSAESKVLQAFTFHSILYLDHILEDLLQYSLWLPCSTGYNSKWRLGDQKYET